MKKMFFLFSVMLIAMQSQAQFLNGIGITAGASAGNQKFSFHDPAAISRKGYGFGYNASIFGEFFTRDYARWITEIQYNQKGSIDKQPEANYPNKLQYISWNNYLKLRYELFSIIPYVLIGPRLEYTLIQSISSPSVSGNFLPIHVSAAFGGGVEVISYSNIKFFAEAFFNPDVMPAYNASALSVKNKNFELRLGLKYEFVQRKEKCNTPTYVE